MFCCLDLGDMGVLTNCSSHPCHSSALSAEVEIRWPCRCDACKVVVHVEDSTSLVHHPGCTYSGKAALIDPDASMHSTPVDGSGCPGTENLPGSQARINCSMLSDDKTPSPPHRSQRMATPDPATPRETTQRQYVFTSPAKPRRKPRPVDSPALKTATLVDLEGKHCSCRSHVVSVPCCCIPQFCAHIWRFHADYAPAQGMCDDRDLHYQDADMLEDISGFESWGADAWKPQDDSDAGDIDDWPPEVGEAVPAGRHASGQGAGNSRQIDSGLEPDDEPSLAQRCHPSEACLEEPDSVQTLRAVQWSTSACKMIRFDCMKDRTCPSCPPGEVCTLRHRRMRGRWVLDKNTSLHVDVPDLHCVKHKKDFSVINTGFWRQMQRLCARTNGDVEVFPDVVAISRDLLITSEAYQCVLLHCYLYLPSCCMHRTVSMNLCRFANVNSCRKMLAQQCENTAVTWAKRSWSTVT